MPVGAPRAAWSLGKLGPDAGAIAALTMALTDRDDQVRQIAAQGLGNIGHADVIAALRPLTQDTSDTGRGTVAAAAIQAIEEIEARRAALQPPTPAVPIDHGEASLDERKRRLGLAVPEAEPAPPLPRPVKPHRRPLLPHHPWPRPGHGKCPASECRWAGHRRIARTTPTTPGA
ncbi:MAG: HEAT repeat domain-containing protein [Anaerolineae bacterium]|nr:MAG: HEAT repeat domain-containing protein [Anaerolineae bacterium]